jgi:hypothetical protein
VTGASLLDLMADIEDASAMRMDGCAVTIGDELSLPENLEEWFPRATLRAWLEEESAALDWENPELARHLRQRPNYEPRRLLGLLAFAYSTAHFEAEEIQRRCHTDPDFQAIAGPRWRPEASELTRFRRENRGLLKWALLQVFKRAIRTRLDDFRLPAGMKRLLLRSATARLDLARQLDAGYDGS